MQKIMVKRALSDSDLEEIMEKYYHNYYIKYLSMGEYGWDLVLVLLKSRPEPEPAFKKNGLFDE